MPARSSAQRRYLNARFGHDWVKEHHYDNPGKLPAHVSPKHEHRDMKKGQTKRHHGKGKR